MALLSPSYISRLGRITELSYRALCLDHCKSKCLAVFRLVNRPSPARPCCLLNNCRLTHSLVIERPISEGSLEISKGDILLEKTRKMMNVIDGKFELIRKNNKSLLLGTYNENIIKFLLRSKVPEAQITSVLCGTPVLSRHPLEAWKETIAFLKSYLFYPHQLLVVLGACPGLMSPSGAERKLLFDALAWLRSCSIGEGRMQVAITKNPAIATTPLMELKRTYAQLLEIFTKAELDALVTSCPSVLTDPWQETSAKIEYVYEAMGMTSKDIVKSLLFKRSLERIVTRHRFLVRQGLYARPNRRGVSPIINAPLRSIMDSDDKAFAVIVARATEAEFAQFVEASRMQRGDGEVESDSELESDDDGPSELEISDSDDEQ